MQDLQGLIVSDFENKANIILGKVEVDKDGLGSWVELQDVKDFSIQSNITNLFQNTCALSFNINLLNTKDRYSFHDTGASCYGHIKEGRKIRLYLGIRTGVTTTEEEIEEFDENFNGDSVDGCIFQGNDVYDTARDNPNGLAVVDLDTFITIGQFYIPDPGEPDYAIYRSALFFDTSDIPEGAIITKATLKIHDTGAPYTYIETAFNIIVQTISFEKPIFAGDYDKTKYSGNLGSISTDDISEGVYNDIELDVSAINKGGETKLGLRSSKDIDGVAPTGIDMLSIYTSEQADKQPKLYIEWEVKEEVETEIEPEDYYWSWLYGIVDKPTTQYDEAGETCNITGRDYIAYLSEIYLKNLWWGKNKKYDIVADQEHYTMEEDCKGIYRAFLDRTGDGTGFEEIWLNSEWTYDWDINEFVFLKPSVPRESGVGCLWLYYFTPQAVENVVADLLVESGILTLSEKFLWLNNPLLCTPTGKQIDRVWFDSGTAYIRAINMLTEVVIYRFYINGNHEACFKPIPELSETVKRINDHEYIIKKTEERLDELYNQIIIKGETREMKRNWLSVMAYSSVSGLDSTSGKLKGATTDDGGNLIIKRGFIWKIEGEADIAWYESGGDLGIGYYEHIITGLTPGTDYKFQAYAEDNKGNKRYSAWYYFRTEEEIS